MHHIRHLFVWLLLMLCPLTLHAQEEIIAAYKRGMGFDIPTPEACLALHPDSLLPALEKKHPKQYFELCRVFIRSALYTGRFTWALDICEEMYRKAFELDHHLGIGLAMRSVADVCFYTHREEEAFEAYDAAYNIFCQLKEEKEENGIHLRMLLIDVVRHSIQYGDTLRADLFLERFDQLITPESPALERAFSYSFHAYRSMQQGELIMADAYMNRISKIESSLPFVARRFLLLQQARLYVAWENSYEALKAYNSYIEGNMRRIHHYQFRKVMLERADLLYRMRRYKDAYQEYQRLKQLYTLESNENAQEKINHMTAQYQTDIQVMNNQNARIKVFSQRTTLLILGIVLVLTSLVSSWLRIFKLRKLQAQELEMKNKAHESILRKNRFLSNMSHEVRTPLNAIVGFAAVLGEEEDLDEETRLEFVNIIKTNSFQLLKLINDILDYNDFDSDRVRYTFAQHNAVRTCREALQSVIMSHKPPHVDMRFETNLKELVVNTDNERLTQVLINLLVNATKFTQEGSIVLRLEKNENTAIFSVTDTGCGIPVEKQQLVFERFEKLSEFTQGTGLGLSICQIIAKRLNGEIWIDSNYTSGARFYFSHPMLQSSQSTF